MADGYNSPLRVHSVDTPAGLDALRGLWAEVLAASEVRTPFMSHAWVRHWWACFGHDQALRILVVEDADGPCAIAPLAVARRALGAFRFRAVEIIGTGALWGVGTGLADRADLLLTRRRSEAIAAILAHLDEMGGWDVIDWRGLPEDATTARALDAGGRAMREPRWRSPYLPLDGGFAEYAARRGRNFRKQLKRKRRKLAAGGAVRIDLDAAARDPDACVARAAAICARSWKGEMGSGLLVQTPTRRLIERLAADPESGVFIAELRVGETVVAYELGFRTEDKIWSYDCAFDADFADGSPGMLLTARIIEDAFERGLREYDFMRGDEGYKLDWGGGVRTENEYVIDAGTMRGLAAREMAFRLRWRLRQDPRLVDLKTRATGMLTRWRKARSPR